MSVIVAPRMVTGEDVLAPAGVVIEGGHVADVLAGPQVETLRADVTLADGLLVPGLVDLQVNGYFGVDLVSATPAEWTAVTTRLPETGVSAFAPTFVTGPLDHLVAGLRRAEHAMVAGPVTGSRIVGVHLEGPFLAGSRRGAHNAAFLRDPTDQALDLLLDAAAPGTLRLVTLAPERPGALDAVRRLAAAGVLVCLGHTDATAAQVSAAADAGARMVTHLFNAQRGLHHREPGVVGAALVDQRLTCGLNRPGERGRRREPSACRPAGPHRPRPDRARCRRRLRLARRRPAHPCNLGRRETCVRGRQGGLRRHELGGQQHMTTKAEQIVSGLGGLDNIVEIEPCITRLRTEVRDSGLVDEAVLRCAGALGVVRAGRVVQVVVGPEADTLASEIGDLSE